jgi:hypothetical protein
VEQKWRRFERAVYEIQKELSPHARVTFDDSIMGAESRTPRQIDVSVRARVGQYEVLIVIECKDQGVPLDVEVVEAFVQKTRDVRANKAAMVSASRYTPAAKQMGEAHGVDLYRLVDAESKEWTTYITVPVLLCRTFLKSYSLTFQDFEKLPPIIAAPSRLSLPILGEDGRRIGTIRDLLFQAWRQFDLADKPGEHRDLPLGRVILSYEGLTYPTELLTNIIVGRAYYLGPLAIESLRGLADVSRGRLVTRQFRTAPLTPADVEAGLVPGWQEVAAPDQLAVKPLFTVYYTDAYEAGTADGEETQEAEDEEATDPKQ